MNMNMGGNAFNAEEALSEEAQETPAATEENNEGDKPAEDSADPTTDADAEETA